jgi:autotransporter translocation and assembly factor TamB
MKKSTLKILAGILATLILVLGGLYWYLPKYLVPVIEGYAKRQNIELRISKIDSWFPLRFKADKVQYTLQDIAYLELEDVTIELEKIFFLNKTFKISALLANKAEINILSGNADLKEVKVEWPSPWLGIRINSLNLKNIHISKGATHYSLDLTGLIDIHPRASQITINSMLSLKTPFEEKLSFELGLAKKTRMVRVETSFEEKGTGWLISKLDSAFPISKTKGSLSATGHLSHFLNLLFQTNLQHSPLYPKIKGQLSASFDFEFNEDVPLKLVLTNKAKIDSQFILSDQNLFELSNLKIQNEKNHLKGFVELDIIKQWIKRGQLSTTLDKLDFLYTQLPSLETSPLYVRFLFKGPLFAPDLELNFTWGNLKYKNVELDDLVGTCKLEALNTGNATLYCNLNGEKIQSSFKFSMDQKLIQFKTIDIESQLFTAKSMATLSLKEKAFLNFEMNGTTNTLHQLTSLFYPLPFEIDAKSARFMCSYALHSDLNLDLYLNELDVKDFYSERAEIRIKTQNPFKDPLSMIQASFFRGNYKKIPIHSLELQTEMGRTENFFESKLNAQQCNISSKGFWNFSGQNVHLTLHELQGTLKKDPFSMQKKTELTLGKQTFILSSTLFQVGKGFVVVAANSETAGFLLKMQDTPSSIFSILDPNIDISGLVVGDFTMQKRNGLLVSHLYFQCENLKASYRNWPLVEQTFTTINAKLQNNAITFDINATTEGQFLNLSGIVPIQQAPYRIATNQDFKLQFTIQEEASHLLQYLHAEGHVLKGYAEGTLEWTGTIEKPVASGALNFKGGSYENFQTGLILENISFSLTGNKEKLELSDLTAKDPKNGSFIGRGSITMDLANKFPFELAVSLDNFLVVELGNVIAATSGLMHLKGNIETATLSGNVGLTAATITIPDKITKAVPKLNYVFKDKVSTKPEYEPTPSTIVNLDLELDILGTLAVRGRGLTSKWIGSVNIKGTTKEPELYGKLDIKEGSFNFAKHTFILTEGAISFDGLAKLKTQINLVAEQQIGDLNVYIALRGPLQQPFLTLSSSPSLPQSVLLARLLFNKDISEIDPFQAIQLAQTAMDLASGEVGILERIQRSTGLDRLSIQAAPKSQQQQTLEDTARTDDTLPVAVQVGKEITKGILITTTQGTTADSRLYSIEFDLKYNLILQLETNQDRDGKISLKWSKSY